VTSNACGPNSAGAAVFLPAMAVGAVTFASTTAPLFHTYMSISGGSPSEGVDMDALLVPV